MNQCKILCSLVAGTSNKLDGIKLNKAITILTTAYNHSLQVSSVSYIKNILEVAIIVARYFRIGLSSILAILLQDTIQDHKIPESTLRQEFGNQTVDIILMLTALKAQFLRSSFLATNKIQFKPCLATFSETNLMVVLIKIAEYMHNMYMLDSVPILEQSKIVNEIKHIYIPLISKLGLNDVQRELEDLQLKFQNKAIYDTICYKIRSTKATKEGFLTRFMGPIHSLMKENFREYVIKSRTKSIASIWHKIESRNIPFEDIHDLYAIRIIFDSEPSQEYSNCWLIYNLITSLYEPRLDRLRDWISYPKHSGYEALHIAVMSQEGQWVEIQIRTTRMDKKAEHGDAAHWKYKNYTLCQDLANVSPTWFNKASAVLQTGWGIANNKMENVGPLYIQPNI